MTLDLSKLNFEIAVDNISQLPEEEYALARRNGLGASDVSVYLGLMEQWKNSLDLIKEKRTTFITPEEREIGEKEVVRKGKDLEPLILQKASTYLDKEIIKPNAMYRHNEYPYLTVNFDGVMEDDGIYIPVECKFVSIGGTKYYNTNQDEGIPEYYKAQLQDQMLFLNAPYGYLAALFDKGWLFHMFRIKRDEAMIRDIIVKGYKIWEKIKI